MFCFTSCKEARSRGGMLPVKGSSISPITICLGNIEMLFPWQRNVEGKVTANQTKHVFLWSLDISFALEIIIKPDIITLESCSYCWKIRPAFSFWEIKHFCGKQPFVFFLFALCCFQVGRVTQDPHQGQTRWLRVVLLCNHLFVMTINILKSFFWERLVYIAIASLYS